ncbi:hypothetical protein M3197_13990 [Sporosarcina aquimarina]|uniref:hypothetical protein n=1 Tax=Sporosarcina aquimarina TaxID=114975 RepID=UPI0020415F8E|nr:hypothetical protein [Sporosarcina aquimarina]MCM3758572.1 hypothetical protein [Sporosarcina aquimarina]
MKQLCLLAAGAISTWFVLGLITGDFDAEILLILGIGVSLGYKVGKRNGAQEVEDSMEERVQ